MPREFTKRQAESSPHRAEQATDTDSDSATSKAQQHCCRKLGDFFIDVAKLIIGGVILAGLMKQDIDYWTLATIGIGAVLGFIAIGLTLIKLSDK